MGQFWHTLLVAPIAVEYVPAAQFVHTETPVDPDHVPAGQFVHPLDPANE